MKGHPHSVDALAKLSEDVIVTGSSDGLVRVVQVLPNKMLGVIADHGTFPIERLRVDRNGAWLGSASHDNVLKLTDVRDALVDSDEEDLGGGSDDSNEEEEEGKGGIDDDSGTGSERSREKPAIERDRKADDLGSESDNPDTRARSDSESESQPEPVLSTKRKKKSQAEEPSNKKGKIDDGFFDEL